MTEQEIELAADAVRAILEHLQEPEVDVLLSEYNSVGDAIKDVSSHLNRLQSGDTAGLGALRILFAPTGSFQEIATVNGWGEEFLRISSLFDAAIGDSA